MKSELSIIVPVYNGEKTIVKCLHSLLAVDMPIEILVVNDGSQDASESLIRSLMKKHTNIHLYTIANQGIAHARNFALAQVSTPYFGFLDADDVVEAGVYRKLLTLMKKEKSTIGFSNFLWVYTDGKQRFATDTGYRDKKEILIKMFATLWNKIYDTAWFRSLNLSFPDGLRYEDASVLYRLALHMDHVSYLPEISVHYIQQKNSITHSFDTHIEDMIKVFRGIRDYYRAQEQEVAYAAEIEYLFIRFFLGNSYLRACRIADKKLRKETLHKGYAFLCQEYPHYHENIYLQQKGKKNWYYRHMNKTFYFMLPPIFRFLYRTGVLSS